MHYSIKSKLFNTLLKIIFRLGILIFEVEQAGSEATLHYFSWGLFSNFFNSEILASDPSISPLLRKLMALLIIATFLIATPVLGSNISKSIRA